jgi:hypothetical protein
MQHIQDNELDRLFKDGFEEAEITPSVNLWDNIETKLAVKPKRVFPVYWMAAAIGLITVSVGVLFFPESSGNAGRSDKIVFANEYKPKVLARPKAVVALPAEKLTTASTVTELVKVTKVIAAEPSASADPKKNLAAMQPLALITHLHTNELTVKQETLPLPAAAAPEVIVLANNDDHSAGNTERSAKGDEVINENEGRTENRSIRNMGDLINYVVDKVDKSDEKIIQFKTEDDNSSLVALNIGIIRFNSKKHK